MAVKPQDQQIDQDDEASKQAVASGEFPPVPDEDGPHDVPDDKVIEKTLPASGSVHKDGKASA